MKTGAESMSIAPHPTPPTPTAKMPLDIYGQLQDNFAKVVVSGPGWCQGTRTWMYCASQATGGAQPGALGY